MAIDQNVPKSDDVPKSEDVEKTLEETKRKSASGLSWDEVDPKPGEKFNRVTEMGEAD